MNNDPCAYHVIFLLNVGDRDEGERRRINQKGNSRERDSAEQSTAKPRQRKGGDGKHVMDGVEDRGRDASLTQMERRMPYTSGAEVPPITIIDRHESVGNLPNYNVAGKEGMDWRESVLGDENNRSTRYLRERVTEVAMVECAR